MERRGGKEEVKEGRRSEKEGGVEEGERMGGKGGNKKAELTLQSSHTNSKTYTT